MNNISFILRPIHLFVNTSIQINTNTNKLCMYVNTEWHRVSVEIGDCMPPGRNNLVLTFLVFKQLEKRQELWTKSAKYICAVMTTRLTSSSVIVSDRRHGPGVARSGCRSSSQCSAHRQANDRQGPHKSTSELLLGLQRAEPLNICTDEHYCFPSSHLLFVRSALWRPAKTQDNRVSADFATRWF